LIIITYHSGEYILLDDEAWPAHADVVTTFELQRRRIAAVLLSCGCLLSAMMLGAASYQLVVDVPNWSAALPESARAFAAVALQRATPARYYAPLTSLAVLVLLASSVMAPGPRSAWKLAAIAALASNVALTVLWVYPRNRLLLFSPNATPAIQVVIRAARDWRGLHALRLAVLAGAVACAARALFGRPAAPPATREREAQWAPRSYRAAGVFALGFLAIGASMVPLARAFAPAAGVSSLAPGLQFPTWLFAAIWAVLYPALGVATFHVWKRRQEPGAVEALIACGMSLAFYLAFLPIAAAAHDQRVTALLDVLGLLYAYLTSWACARVDTRSLPWLSPLLLWMPVTALLKIATL
jgi:tryptophan-rich sensory protein